MKNSDLYDRLPSIIWTKFLGAPVSVLSKRANRGKCNIGRGRKHIKRLLPRVLSELSGDKVRLWASQPTRAGTTSRVLRTMVHICATSSEKRCRFLGSKAYYLSYPITPGTRCGHHCRANTSRPPNLPTTVRTGTAELSGIAMVRVSKPRAGMGLEFLDFDWDSTRIFLAWIESGREST